MGKKIFGSRTVFSQKAKINVSWNIFEWTFGLKKKFKKTFWTIFPFLSPLFRKKFSSIFSSCFAMINALGFDIVLSSKFSWKNKHPEIVNQKEKTQKKLSVFCIIIVYLQVATIFILNYFEGFLTGISWWSLE